MASQFIREYDSPVADMEYGGVVDGVTQRTAPVGHLLDAGQLQALAAGQLQALAARFLGRGRKLPLPNYLAASTCR